MIRLSPTAVLKYDTCPRQYELEVVRRIRPVHRTAHLVFGTVIHHALADWLRGWHQGQPPDAVALFDQYWDAAQQQGGIEYVATPSSASLADTGRALMRAWPTHWQRSQHRLATDVAGQPLIECKLEVQISGTLTFVGQLDVLTCDPEGRWVCLDFKTPSTPTDPSWLAVADQLTGYQVLLDAHAPRLGIGPVDRLGFWELIKRKVTPKGKGPAVCAPITVSRRSPADRQDYLQKVLWVAEDIARDRFPKRGLMAHYSPCPLCAVRGLCQDSDTDGLVIPESVASVTA